MAAIVKLTELPEQAVLSIGWVAIVTGLFTITVAVAVVPIHPAGEMEFTVKSTLVALGFELLSDPVIVVPSGTLVPFVAILPDMPEGVVLLQVYVVPEILLLLLNTIPVITLPEQMV